MDCHDIWDSVLSIKAWIWHALQTNFWTSLIGALAGAWGGAIAAQRIGAKSEIRKRLMEELRNTNAAIIAAISIANAMATIKRQHVKSLKQTYDHKYAELEALQAAAAEGRAKGVYRFTADFKTLPPLRTAISRLSALLYEKVTVKPGILGLLELLHLSLDNFDLMTAARTAMIEEIRTTGPHADDRLAEIYFGLTDGNGNTDSRYGDAVEGIYDAVDDGIVFSIWLAKALMVRGKELADELGKKAPVVTKASFQKLTDEGLIPALTESYRGTFETLMLGIEIEPGAS